MSFHSVRANHFTATTFAAALLMVALCTQVRAGVITVDSGTGAVYDAIIDGFPGVYVKDGVPDAGGNALAVALKSGVTELRSVAQFPLTALAGLTAGDIVSATLTFNIDDVIGSFGPGAAFDGTASENIFAWAWDGTGTIALADFNKVTGAPTGVVVTGPAGSITDATLAVSGPVDFSVDLTAALQARLTSGASHLGVTLATLDENSATSLDDMGLNTAGPPGVGGAHMPVLRIVTVEAAPPTLSRAGRICQTTIAQRARSYQAAVTGALNLCFNRVLSDIAAGKGSAAAAAFCANRLAPTATTRGAVAKLRTQSAAAIASACKLPLTPSGLGAPCDAGATTFAQVATCVLDAASTHAQALTRANYGRACSILTAVELDAAYPTICESTP